MRFLQSLHRANDEIKPNRLRQLFLVCRRALLITSCVVLTACSSDVEIVSMLPQNDGNEVLSVLLNAGIAAHKVVDKDGMVAVSVDSSQVATAIDILRNRGLPRSDYQGLGQVFKKDGMISSPIEEKSRLLFALSQELSKTISRIDGVIFARVHLVLPDHDPFSDISVASSAAVFIKFQKEYNLDLLVPQIKKMVSRSIPGLTEDRVAVVLVPSEDVQTTIRKITRHETSKNHENNIMMFVMFIGVVLGLFGLAGYYLLRDQINEFLHSKKEKDDQEQSK